MMDGEISDEEKIEKVNHFSQQLVNSGYKWSQIREVVISSLRSVVKREKKIENGQERFRTGEQSLTTRIKKKLTEATDWYKRNGERDRDDEEEIEKEVDLFKNKAWKCWRQKRRKNIGNPIEKLELEKLKNGAEVRGVLFISHTQMSELGKRIRGKLNEFENISVLSVKVVERAGEKIVDALHKSNPWDDESCLIEDCLFRYGNDEKMIDNT